MFHGKVSHPVGNVRGRLMLGRLTTEKAPASMLVDRGHARHLVRGIENMHRTSTRARRIEAQR